MKRIIASLVALLISASVWAAKLPDESMPDNLPTMFPCHHDEMGGLVCRWHAVDRTVPVYSEAAGQYLNYNNRTEAVCDNGICKNGASGNVVGKWKENVHLSLSIWYYVWESEDGKPIAYRRDVGPKADKGLGNYPYLAAGETFYYWLRNHGYQGNDLENALAWAYQGGSRQFHLDEYKKTGNANVPPEIVYPTVVTKSKATPEVWCNPQKDDDCTVNNKKVHKADLGKYLPKVDPAKVRAEGGYCEPPVCYSEDDVPLGVLK